MVINCIDFEFLKRVIGILMVNSWYCIIICVGGCFVFVLGELFVDVILLGICFVVEVFLRWCGFLDEGWVKVIFGVGVLLWGLVFCVCCLL